MIDQDIRRKIEGLLTRAPALASASIQRPRVLTSRPSPQAWMAGGASEKEYDPSHNDQHTAQCRAWITEALNIIELAVPTPSNAYRRQIEKIGEAAASRYPRSVGSMAEILRALLRDIDAGLLVTLSSKIRAETFGDFLEHAEAYCKDRRHKEAGVIAGVVFEDTVRRICRDNGISDKGQSLEDLINALAKLGKITRQQSKQAKVASHVRTKATHAQWDEFDLQGVSDTIQVTRRFLQEHLGG